MCSAKDRIKTAEKILVDLDEGKLDRYIND